MKQNEFLAIASVLVQKHFPKGKSKERGEAMVLVADLVLELMEHGIVEP